MVRRFNILIIMIFALTAFANLVFGRTYYIAKTGNDNNTGTSWANAWLTVAKVNSTISHGDTVFFGSGEWFASTIYPPTGMSEPKTVYACSTYTLETAHTATIYSGDSVGSWTLHSGNVYKADWTPSAEDENFQNFPNYPCVVGGDSIYLAKLSIGAVTVPGYFYYDYTGDVLYIYPYISGDPDTSGHRILASARAGSIYIDGGTRYTEVFGLDFKNAFGGVVVFKSHAIKQSLNSFIHCNIAHTTTGQGNNASIVYMGSYGDDGNPDTLSGFGYGNVFRACTLYSVSSAGQEGSSHAGSGATFYGMRQTVFDSCHFSLMPGAGVMWKGGGLDYYGNRISFCTFDGTDSMPYGRPTFTKAAVEHACGADRDSVYGCIFKNIISYDPIRASAFGILEGDCNPANSRYFAGDFFCNNTLYNCELFWVAHCETPEAGFEEIIFKYNVSEKIVRNVSQWIRSSNTGTIIDNTDYCEIDSNYWYDPFYSFIFYNQMGTNRNWTYWTGTKGYDIHGYNSDPGLASPENDDFSRPNAPQEMNLYYGGKLWTKFGAIQGIPPPDTTAPELNNIRSTDTTSNSVNIQWDTNEPATSQVEYGTTSNYGSSTQFDPSLVYSHAQTITGLFPLTTYHYRVRSTDGAGNEAVSGDFTFEILAPDTNPPIISGVTASNITSHSAVISWITNEVSTSQVNYGFTVGYGQSSNLYQALVLNHNVILSGLQPDTLYHFRVRSSDAAGNEAVSGDFEFHTDTLTISDWDIISIGVSTEVSGTFQGYSTTAINDSVINPRGGMSSTWASNDTTMPHWVEFDFDDTVLVAGMIVYWAWSNHSSSWLYSQQYRIQYWDEGGTFVDIETVNNSVADSVTATWFDTTVTTTRIRYYQPANMGPPTYPTIVVLTELEIYGSAGIPAPEPIGTVILGDSSAMVFADPVYVQIPVFYEFALDIDSTYPNPRIEPPLVVDTVISTTFGGLSSPYTYYWKCRAIASDLSDTSSWSWTEAFNLYSTNSQTYSDAYPDSNEEINSSYSHFDIRFIPVPESVFIEIDDNPVFSSPFGTVLTNLNQGMASWRPDSAEISTRLFTKNGVYYWRASTDSIDWITFPFKLELDVYAYPVPFRKSDGHSRITFTNLPENSKIVIASVSGAIVFTKAGVGSGDWVWDVRNDNGRDLASGVYLYAVDSKGGVTQGKIVVIR